jgi:hypothetical protein
MNLHLRMLEDAAALKDDARTAVLRGRSCDGIALLDPEPRQVQAPSSSQRLEHPHALPRRHRSQKTPDNQYRSNEF